MVGEFAFVCLMVVMVVAFVESRVTKLKRGGGILPTTTDEISVEPHSLLLPRIRKSRSHDTFVV